MCADDIASIIHFCSHPDIIIVMSHLEFSLMSNYYFAPTPIGILLMELHVKIAIRCKGLLQQIRL